jgi:hypothetical protein
MGWKHDNVNGSWSLIGVMIVLALFVIASASIGIQCINRRDNKDDSDNKGFLIGLICVAIVTPIITVLVKGF